MTREPIPVSAEQEQARCESTSPIYKFDVCARRCRLEKGHAGAHQAKTSDGSGDIIEPRFDYDVAWED